MGCVANKSRIDKNIRQVYELHFVYGTWPIKWVWSVASIFESL